MLLYEHMARTSWDRLFWQIDIAAIDKPSDFGKKKTFHSMITSLSPMTKGKYFDATVSDDSGQMRLVSFSEDILRIRKGSPWKGVFHGTHGTPSKSATALPPLPWRTWLCCHPNCTYEIIRISNYSIIILYAHRIHTFFSHQIVWTKE